MIDWNKLKALYYVVKCGGFTKAAHKLNLSQSAVSRQITGLEDRLKLKLFERDNSTLRITPAGQRLFDLAENFMVATESTLKMLHNTDLLLEGELVLGAMLPFAGAVLPPLLSEFVARYPKLRLHLNSAIGEVLIEESDAAVRVYLPNRKDLAQDYLYTSQIKLFASAGYLEKFGVPKTPRDLDSHRLLAYSLESQKGFAHSNWLLRLGLGGGRVREPYMVCNSSLELLMAAKYGLGIVELTADYPKAMGVELQDVLPAIEGPHVELYYVYPKALEHSARVLALRDFLWEKLETPQDRR